VRDIFIALVEPDDMRVVEVLHNGVYNDFPVLGVLFEAVDENVEKVGVVLEKLEELIRGRKHSGQVFIMAPLLALSNAELDAYAHFYAQHLSGHKRFLDYLRLGNIVIDQRDA